MLIDSLNLKDKMLPTTFTTLDNKIQYVPVAAHAQAPQAVMLPAAPVMFMPQMVPAQIPFQPAPLPTLPILPMQSLPANNSLPLFYDGSSFTELPQTLQNYSGEGLLVPPPGYSFVTMDVPSASVERSASAELEENNADLDLLPVPIETVRSRSRSSSVVSNIAEEETSSRAEGETTAPKQQNKKYRHRSKQTRILEVHQKLKEEYTAKGLYAGDDEVLRGFDTVRVHVKTYKALNRIECPLNDVEKHPDVTVMKIATPFSMKNRFQKKGFIVYLKLQNSSMVPIVQEIFSHYKEDFAKCDVALKKEDKLALDRARQASLKEGDLSTRSLSSMSDLSSSQFLSERAYSREGMLNVADWANSGMAA